MFKIYRKIQAVQTKDTKDLFNQEYLSLVQNAKLMR
jgi:hypothetical protein